MVALGWTTEQRNGRPYHLSFGFGERIDWLATAFCDMSSPGGGIMGDLNGTGADEAYRTGKAMSLLRPMVRLSCSTSVKSYGCYCVGAFSQFCCVDSCRIRRNEQVAICLSRSILVDFDSSVLDSGKYTVH